MRDFTKVGAALHGGVLTRLRSCLVAGLAVLVFLCLAGGATQRADAATRYAAIVIEESTGKVLFARNADKARFPASLAKIMTLYLLFEEIEAGRVTLDTRMKVSQVAAGRSPSKLYLRRGQTITVRDAIPALITKSANDVATIVSEHISGTEREFAKRMTRKARAIGMSRTTFRNASGLPHSQQRTTARDMAKLAVAIRNDFPQYFEFFQMKAFSWKGRNFRNHNNLLKKLSGTDGIKTGYIKASGFNLVTTVQRNGVRLVGVVFGGRTSHTRDAHMVSILNRSFNRISPAEIRNQIAANAPRLPSGLPQTLPVPLRAPGNLPVPPPLGTKRTRLAVSLGGESEYLDPDTARIARDDGKGKLWSVQVGSFAKRVNAHKAAVNARRAATEVIGGTPARLSVVTRGDIPLWRARFPNLNEHQARSVCAALYVKGKSCLAIRQPKSGSG